jgi:uncharacterized protein
MFQNTQVLGVKVPFHTNFEEVNLRFYVKRWDGKNWKRGVVFIKEIVPRVAITWIANSFYNEHYETMPMKHSWKNSDNRIEISYQWKKGQWYSLNLIANNDLLEIGSGSEAEFITEHYWGYAKVNEKKTNEYEVKHPRWKQYEVLNTQIDVDFGLIYGDKFAFLNQYKPVSSILAEGSEISVEPKRVIV